MKSYRDGLVLGVGAGLGAALILALIDTALAMGKADGLGFVPAVLALWGLPALAIGLGVGLVAGAITATWGDGAITRAVRALRDDRGRDVTISAAILAGAVAAVPLILIVRILATRLVLGVQRPAVGTVLLGISVVVVVIVLAALALPIYRATRLATAAMPAVGRLPRAVVLAIGLPIVVVAAALFYVFTRLDWRALGVGSLFAIGALPILTLIVAWLASGPAAGAVRKIPARGPIVVGAATVAVLLPILTLRGQPSREVEIAVTDHSLIGARAIPFLRSLYDGDGDGASNFFSHTVVDCDDGNPAVHPDAPEIPGNGIDDNCEGGDRIATVKPPDPIPDPNSGSGSGTVKRKIAFDGNLLVILVDTVRADRLGAAGYQRDGKSLTPRLDALISESVWFSRAYAQSPNTPRSVPSIMSSRYPSQIDVDPSIDANYPTVTDKNDLLFESLQAAELRTIAFTSHFYFCDEVRRPGECAGFKKKKHSNIGQGADEWDNTGVVDVMPSNKDVAAPRIVPRAVARLDELARARQRFAMLVHLFEPHSTYVEHAEWPITERSIAGLRQKYDYEIAFVDRWIGTLLDALKSSGLDGSTMVVVVSDHGEAFGVHTFAGQEMFFHGQTLYDELLRVPLIVKVPGVAPRKHDGVVELIDVAPTIADVLGVPRPASWVGRSLVPAMVGETLPAKAAFGELLPAPSWPHKAKSMVSADGKWKLFYRMDDRRYELYDLAADPEERRDLFAKDRARADEMTTALVDWMEVELQK